MTNGCTCQHCKPPSFNLLRAAVYHRAIRRRRRRGEAKRKTSVARDLPRRGLIAAAATPRFARRHKAARDKRSRGMTIQSDCASPSTLIAVFSSCPFVIEKHESIKFKEAFFSRRAETLLDTGNRLIGIMKKPAAERSVALHPRFPANESSLFPSSLIPAIVLCLTSNACSLCLVISTIGPLVSCASDVSASGQVLVVAGPDNDNGHRDTSDKTHARASRSLRRSALSQFPPSSYLIVSIIMKNSVELFSAHSHPVLSLPLSLFPLPFSLSFSAFDASE